MIVMVLFDSILGLVAQVGDAIFASLLHRIATTQGP